MSISLVESGLSFELALAPALLDATESAARAASAWVGRGDKASLDAAAVDAMRAALVEAPFEGVVVIGEGEKDEAPMLYLGERLGRTGPAADLAVDPVDGTTLASRGGPGSIAVIGAAPRGALLQTPAHYMDKVVVGPAARGQIDPERGPVDNLLAIARAVGRRPCDLVVAMLDRPRNEHVLAAVREIGARAKLFGDGDIVNALLAVLGDGRVDALMGIGGAPEGVITACAVRALGGDMCGRIDPKQPLTLDDLCADPTALFVASGVTAGELLEGVRRDGTTVYVHSMVISSRNGAVRVIETQWRKE
jgi:fructose-1,6-bisphosphatase II